MPELPEVERYRRVAETAVDRPVSSVAVPDVRFLKSGTTPARLRRALVGHRITAARRTGKLLLVDTDGGSTVGIRFGMTGSLVVDGANGVGRLLYTSGRHDRKWERCTVRFEDGGALVVHDPRFLGGITVDPDVSHLGPDALVVSSAGLLAALGGSSAPLKARLLDQSKVAGIGNLIADEVLWRAGLDPTRPAGSLSSTEVRRLHRQLQRTLADLMERGGSHRGDLMGERHRGGRCPRDGAALARQTVGGRTTWWCPAHQH